MAVNMAKTWVDWFLIWRHNYLAGKDEDEDSDPIVIPPIIKWTPKAEEIIEKTKIKGIVVVVLALALLTSRRK